jgi:hypothetical protein
MQAAGAGAFGPGSRRHGRRGIPVSSVVWEVPLPRVAPSDINKLALLLAPRRRLRPRGIDAGTPLNVASLLPMGGAGAHATPHYRVMIQVCVWHLAKVLICLTLNF